MIYNTPKNFMFFDIIINPVWISDTLVRRQNVSTNGMDYQFETDKLMFGAYFFIATTMTEHQ